MSGGGTIIPNRQEINVRVIYLSLSLFAVSSWALAATTPSVKPYLSSALADPSRASDAAIDARRKPGEIIAFSGAKPGDKVVDLIPGSGYFSKIFSGVVGPKGQVYMIWPTEYTKVAHSDPENSRALAASPEYRNITVIQQPAAEFATPEPVDLVFTSQNYHDYPNKLMGKVDLLSFDRAVYKTLKPGGVFLIVDHAAEAGSGLRDTETLHRIDPAIVKQQLAQAGFIFEGESLVLRNPDDDHQKLVFDKAIRGSTDRFIYRFRKPQ
jgi:predicted methyltransferase